MPCALQPLMFCLLMCRCLLFNGFDLLKLLRASNIPQAQSVPVIAVTARSDMQREEFTVHGFAGCLHKPFTVSELLHELNMEDKRDGGYGSFGNFGLPGV